MSDDKPKREPNGPTEAERQWFEATDRFYRVLERQGHTEALKTAQAVLEKLPPAKQGGNTNAR